MRKHSSSTCHKEIAVCSRIEVLKINLSNVHCEILEDTEIL